MASRIEATDWLAESPDRLRPAIEGCATGALPPNVALLRLAAESSSPEEVESALAGAIGRASGREARRLGEALDLWRANPQAFATVRSVLDGVDHADADRDPEQGLARWAATFDRLAGAAPEEGVALYALGNPDLLRAATAEVVDRLGEWDLLGSGRRMVEIGCGIGRFVAALAPRMGEVTGLDISEGMIARARERCAGLANARLAVSSGRDLAGVGSRSADLVLAADVFPYLVQAGVAEDHVAEAARVLRPGGHLLILNFSYRGDPARDGAEVGDLAARHGFEVRRASAGDFALWDATTFLLRRI